MKNEISNKFIELIEIMERLRSENGCEWDKEQTHESLKPYVIEEAYEVVESINSGHYEELSDELGDLLLQIIFHAQVAKENGAFDMEDVLDKINDKMIRRHPHVFGDSEGYSYEQWEKLKALEKKEEKFSRVGKYKKGLPPLTQIRRLYENSLAVGFDPYYQKDLIEEMKKDLDEGNHYELLKKHMYLLVKEKIDVDSTLQKISKEFHEKFLKLEKELGKNFNNKNNIEKQKVWNKIEEGNL